MYKYNAVIQDTPRWAPKTDLRNLFFFQINIKKNIFIIRGVSMCHCNLYRCEYIHIFITISLFCDKNKYVSIRVIHFKFYYVICLYLSPVLLNAKCTSQSLDQNIYKCKHTYIQGVCF